MELVRVRILNIHPNFPNVPRCYQLLKSVAKDPQTTGVVTVTIIVCLLVKHQVICIKNRKECHPKARNENDDQTDSLLVYDFVSELSFVHR